MQARELCQRLGETPQLFPVLWGLARAYEFRGELHLALQLGEQLLAVAERLRDSDLLLEAHHTLWATQYLLGELASAQAHSERCIKLYDPQQHRQYASLYGGHDPGVCALGIEAGVLWLRGFADQALERAHAALSPAKELSHPFSPAFAIYRVIWTHRHRGDMQSTRELVDSLLALADEHAFPIWKAHAAVTRGWLLVSEGLREEGLAQLRQAHQAVGTVRDRSDYLALLAEVTGMQKKWSKGST